jgi:peptidylamidoglycolate lyase
MTASQLLVGVAVLCAWLSALGPGCSSPGTSPPPRLAAEHGVAPHKGGEDDSGPYEVDPSWPRPLSAELTWGRTSSIFAENPNRIFIIQSGMVPKTWKRLEGERLNGASWSGGTSSRQSTQATHCASTLTWRKGPYHCKIAPDGSRVDALVDQKSDPPGKTIEGARWEHILMVFDGQGRLVDTWDQYKSLFGHPHQLVIDPYDPDRHVWVIDAGSDQIFKFTNDGKKLAMALGENRIPGNDRTHFDGPTSIAFLPNGDFYITDGYKNTRVVKFSKDGQYLMEWGKPGKGPGEFNTVHGISIDANGRIYVSDRANSRIQIFDLNGKYLDEWRDIRFPVFHAISKDQHFWLSDGDSNKILKYDLNGQLLYSWGTFGERPGDFWCVHHFSVDSDGNLYTAEVYGGRAQKFHPRKGADPRALIGPLVSPGSLGLFGSLAKE